MFGCICFSVNTLLPTRSHPPKSLGSKGGAGLNCIFPDKKKKLETFLRKKPVIPSPRRLPHSWKTVRSDTSKHKGLHCPISRNRLSGFLLFIVQVPKIQRCVQQLVGPQVGVSTAGQMLQSWAPGGRPQWGGHVLPGCAAPALPPARVRRVWERAVGAEGLSRSPARAEGGWVVFRASLKFLPLLPHEEMVSPSDDRRGAGWQSFPRRCFGWSVSGTVFPCKYLHN